MVRIVGVAGVLDAAVISTASVLVISTGALLLFSVTAALERWIDRVPRPAEPLAGDAQPAPRPRRPELFDQDATPATRRAS